jgi:predicted DNA-binding ArsR family transcriptional regulator
LKKSRPVRKKRPNAISLKIFDCLQESGYITQAELAEAVGRDPKRLTAILKQHILGGRIELVVGLTREGIEARKEWSPEYRRVQWAKYMRDYRQRRKTISNRKSVNCLSEQQSQ